MEQIILDTPTIEPEIAATTRPWGQQRQYAHNYPVTVSLMTIQPGRRLSLQSHPGRAELWIIFDPGTLVQVDDKIWEPSVGDEVWIPANARHRVTALGSAVRVLEVAYGNWQQDDIVRYEDDYGRVGEQ